MLQKFRAMLQNDTIKARLMDERDLNRTLNRMARQIVLSGRKVWVAPEAGILFAHYSDQGPMYYTVAFGEVRQAISVLKKRSGHHEHTIREFQITDSGVRVGQPLHEFHGSRKCAPGVDQNAVGIEEEPTWETIRREDTSSEVPDSAVQRTRRSSRSTP
jgi:hypothetical protein